MLNDAVIPTTQRTVNPASSQYPALSPQQHAEHLSPNPGNQQKDRRQRHTDEQFHLMMQPAAVIQNSDGATRVAPVTIPILCAAALSNETTPPASPRHK